MMINSMTGFGRAERMINGIRISFEIRSVNHRHQEIMFKMPKDLLILEDQMKKIIKDFIKRGRVDVFVTMEMEENPLQSIKVDWNLANQYIDVVNELQDKLHINGDIEIKELINFPDLIRVGQANIDAEEMKEHIFDTLEQACENLLNMRNKEGANLHSDLTNRIANLDGMVQEMTARAPYIIEEYRTKLMERISDWLSESVELDEARLLNEVAFFTDKANIDEELTRLKSHLKQFLFILDEKEPVGRKLDFLIQEMNREINTIGSKANDIALSKLVVETKSELEKIREQVQNVE